MSLVISILRRVPDRTVIVESVCPSLQTLSASDEDDIFYCYSKRRKK